MSMCVSGVFARSTSGSNHLCGWEHPARVCARIQTAPIGMNYLGKSLFYLCTVRWPRAHKVLLPVSQETTLIHHPPQRRMPPSHPQTPAHFPACSSGPLQMSLYRSHTSLKTGCLKLLW